MSWYRQRQLNATTKNDGGTAVVEDVRNGGPQGRKRKRKRFAQRCPNRRFSR